MQGLLLGMVMVLLVIACANIANLMLSRGRSRAREVALRLAIGASRGRLVRQLMVENLLMACAGGGLGLLIAAYAVSVFSTLEAPGDVPVVFAFQLDGRVLTFTALVSVVSAVLFGLVPAFQSTRTDLVSALKAGESEQTRTRLLGRQSLVVAQVAGSLVLLVVATQLSRGFLVLLTANPGFRTDHLITMRIDPTLAGYSPARIADFYRTLTERAREVPGVKSAALTFSLPMAAGFMIQAVIPEGYQFPRGVSSTVVVTDAVDDHYFETLGVGMLEGRGFLATDRADSAGVAVVNQTFATRYLGARPLGRRILLNDEGGRMVEVVGVTVPGKHISIFEPPVEFMYLPLSQHPRPRMTLVAETEADSAAMAAPLREMVRSIDPNVPIFSVRTMADLFEQRAVKVAHLITGIVGSVGIAGLFLALVGLYAVVAYQVSRKTHEIGVRMALGAARGQVMRMILKQATIMGVTGVAIGMALSFAGRRALTMGLGLPALDATLFCVIPATLLAITMLAAAIPARRAARIEPMLALRQD
jgi:predicted permease